MPTMTKPHNPARTIRVPDTLWEAAQAKAEQRDESVSAVIRRALRSYANDDTTQSP